MLPDKGTAFCMGAAIVGTMSTNIEISSPVIVCISTVINPTFWCNLDVLPNDANQISVVLVGDMPNSLTISVDISEH